jgi:hypothetical protein
MLRALVLLLGIVMCPGASSVCAQSLNWEGQTGVFVTPLAYTAPSGENGFGNPVVAYHYLEAGRVLGGFHQVSVTEGAFGRLEFGYTRDIHQEGKNWMPSFSVGFVARTQVHNVGGVIQDKDTTNADFYVVATKTATKIHKLPMVFNLGFKATNASLLGLVGNAPGYQGRVFAAARFAFRGPARSTILLGSEFLQEPRRVAGLPGVGVPSTITYAVRIIPTGAVPMRGWGVESPKLTIDLGLLQAAGNVAPGVNLEARHQFALGISYGF